MLPGFRGISTIRHGRNGLASTAPILSSGSPRLDIDLDSSGLIKRSLSLTYLPPSSDGSSIKFSMDRH